MLVSPGLADGLTNAAIPLMNTHRTITGWFHPDCGLGKARAWNALKRAWSYCLDQLYDSPMTRIMK
jgi:hypothetical protein